MEKIIRAVNGVSLGVTLRGKGQEAVVLLHGLTSSSMDWEEVAKVFSKEMTVVAIDFPGHGLARKEELQPLSKLAEAVTDVTERLGIYLPYLVGHSMGGQIAMLAVIERPLFYKKLILCAPAGLERFTEGEKNILKQAIYKMPKGMERFRDAAKHVMSFGGFAAWPNAIPSGETDPVVAHYMPAMLDSSPVDRLQEVILPTLIIFGENDTLIPNPFLHQISTTAFADIAVKPLPYKQLKIYKEAGHYPHLDFPRTFNLDLYRFMVRR